MTDLEHGGSDPVRTGPAVHLYATANGVPEQDLIEILSARLVVGHS